jgi:hypothetical protein
MIGNETAKAFAVDILDREIMKNMVIEVFKCFHKENVIHLAE